MAKKQDDVSKLSFEEAVQRVEALIDGIESGEVGLEESIEQYEVGTKLLAHCRSILNRAEQRIAKLTEESGKLQSDAGATEADGE